MFKLTDPIDKKTGEPVHPQTRKPRGKPTVQAHELMPDGLQPDFICWKVAGGVASEHDRLYYTVDYVRVWQQYAYMAIEQAVSESIPMPKD